MLPLRVTPAGFLSVVVAIVVLPSNARARDTNPAPSNVAPEPSPDPASTHADDGRLRAGLDFFGGYGAGGGASGPVYGARIRLGWQLDRHAAVYLQGAVLYWDSTQVSTRSGAIASGEYGFNLTPMLSFTPNDFIEIAAGPSFDGLVTGRAVADASSSASRAGGDSVTYAGTYLGAHGRFAAHFASAPKPDTGRRVSFTLSGDLHATFAEATVPSFLTLGVGADWY